jgi:hypothetical protein
MPSASAGWFRWLRLIGWPATTRNTGIRLVEVSSTATNERPVGKRTIAKRSFLIKRIADIISTVTAGFYRVEWMSINEP